MNEVNFQTEIQSKQNFDGHHRLTAHFYERSGVLPIRFILINIWCYFLSKCSTLYHEFFSKRKKTFLSEVGFEPTPSFEDQNSQSLEKGISLESGALDRSAILTCYKMGSDKFIQFQDL